MLRLFPLLLMLASLAACYVYEPLTTLEPAPGTRVSLVLSDQGRVAATPQIGPYAVRVEGSLLQTTETEYLVSVSDVLDIRGTHNKWTGESVPFARSSVVTTFEKRLSRPRTIGLAIGLVSAVVAIIASRSLLGIGGHGGDPAGGGGNGQ